MNENKMMSYEMYEELKSSIMKTIKTEIANARPTTTLPNNLSQQIEQAVTNGLAHCGTTLEGISESIAKKTVGGTERGEEYTQCSISYCDAQGTAATTA